MTLRNEQIITGVLIGYVTVTHLNDQTLVGIKEGTTLTGVPG